MSFPELPSILQGVRLVLACMTFITANDSERTIFVVFPGLPSWTSGNPLIRQMTLAGVERSHDELYLSA